MTSDLINYRLQDSKEKLSSAEILFDNCKFKDSISRSYYAMFTAARALLATKNLDSNKHSGVISLFNQHFVKEEIVPKNLGKILMQSRDLRQDGDYKDFAEPTKEEAQEQCNDAKNFISIIEDTLIKLGYSI